MSKSQLEGMPIANIVLGEIINEKTNEVYYFDTAQKAEITPDLSQGKEEILRVKNRLIGMNRTEDICIGYKIKLTNCTFSPELMSIIDAGQNSSNGNYVGPKVGVAVEKTPFTLNLYTEEKDYDSETVSYVKFCYKHSKGKPIGQKFEDGKFYVVEFEATSRPKKGESPIYIEKVSTLPSTESNGGTSNPTLPPVDGVVTDKNDDVEVKITDRIVWTFKNQINQDDVIPDNFIIKNKNTQAIIQGNITIDITKKIVTYVPLGLLGGTAYTAEAKAVRVLGTSDTTIPIVVDFVTAGGN